MDGDVFGRQDAFPWLHRVDIVDVADRVAIRDQVHDFLGRHECQIQHQLSKSISNIKTFDSQIIFRNVLIVKLFSNQSKNQRR